MRRHRRRLGRAFGDLPAARRAMHRSRTYRGCTLELWRGSEKDYGQSAYEVKVYKGSWHHPEGNVFGPTAEKAFTKARALVDAMKGD